MSDAPSVVQALAKVMADVQAVGKGSTNTQQGSMRYVRAPFWHKAAVGGLDDCWPWLAGRTNGYGRSGDSYAHRVAYELIVGPIPDGMTIDHLCRNRACVNPLHLEVVTRAENSRRGEPHRTARSGGRYLAERTHCVNGHEYAAGSHRIVDGARICRLCARDRRRAFQQRTGR